MCVRERERVNETERERDSVREGAYKREMKKETERGKGGQFYALRRVYVVYLHTQTHGLYIHAAGGYMTCRW